jgi:hypothetical protein
MRKSYSDPQRLNHLPKAHPRNFAKAVRLGLWLVLSGLCVFCPNARATQLLHYTFEDNTNALFAIDSSPSPTNGFFTGTASRTTLGATPNGTGYALNVVGGNGGSQNWLTVSNCSKLSPAVGFTTNLTITFWINLQGNPSASDRVISKEIVGPPAAGFGVQIYGPGSSSPTATNFALSFGVNNVAGIAKTTSTLNASNRWVFCAVTYDGSKPAGTTGYPNVYWYSGTPSSAVAQLGNSYDANKGFITNTTVPLRIGSTPASGSDRTPPAWIDDVQVFDAVLTPAELETIRQANALPGASVSLSTPSVVFAGTNVTLTAVTTALGAQAPTYQWWYNTNLIDGATNATYTITSVQVSDTGLYGVVVSNNVANPPITNASAFLTVQPKAFNPSSLSLVWSLGYSQLNFLNGFALDRSMAYNAFSTNLILCHRASTPYVAVLDPLTGASKGSLDQSGLVSLGYANSFPLNQIGVGEDGAIYSGNMTLVGTDVPYALYRWQDESASQTLAYYGDPGAPNFPNLRWGDAMAVRGAGTNTQILLSSGDANSNSTDTVFCLLTTVDGLNFTSQAFTVTNLPGASANVGLAWGAETNTFFAKSPGYGYAAEAITNQFGQVYTNYPYTNKVYYVQFDANTGFGAALAGYSTTLVSGKTGPLGTESKSNWLAGLEISSTPNSGYDYLSLYGIPNPTGSPTLLGQTVVSYNTQNGPYGGVGSVNFGNINGTNFVFVLDTFNGIYTYAVNPSALASALAPPAITAITPDKGRTNGNTLVTISGSNFLAGVTVNFGAIQGQGVNLIGSTNIQVYTPASAAGAVNVVVSNPNGLSITNIGGYAYVLPPPPATIFGGSISQAGGSLDMVWLGGTNNACELQVTTNLTPPVIWSPVSTNQVGADGLSTNSLPINTAVPAQFYRLAIPYN